MKRLIVLSLILIGLFAGVSMGVEITNTMVAAQLSITNYFPGYILVSSTNGTAGGTGLSTGTCYACFSVTDIDYLTETQASGTNRINNLIRGIVEEAEGRYSAIASTNRPAKMSMTKTVGTSSGTADYTEKLKIETEVVVTTGASEDE